MRKTAVLLIGVLLLAAAHAISQQKPSSSAAGAPGGSSSQSTTSDDLLRQQVQAQLNNDSALSDVRAEVANGAVRLTGTVASRTDRSRALDLARSVPGVLGVKERIEVRRDAEAAPAKQPAVTGHTAINETNHNTAGSIAGNAGVAGVSPATGQAAPQSAAADDDDSPADNHAGLASTMPGEPGNQELRQQIENAFQSDPVLAGTHIVVNVTDSQIELSGMVPTGREKQTAYRIAQSYGNNRRVEDGALNVGEKTGASGAAAGETQPPNH